MCVENFCSLVKCDREVRDNGREVEEGLMYLENGLVPSPKRTLRRMMANVD